MTETATFKDKANQVWGKTKENTKKAWGKTKEVTKKTWERASRPMVKQRLTGKPHTKLVRTQVLTTMSM